MYVCVYVYSFKSVYIHGDIACDCSSNIKHYHLVCRSIPMILSGLSEISLDYSYIPWQ